MALINCPECGKEISDTSTTCINCGFKFKKTSRKRPIILIAIFIALLIVGIISWAVFFNKPTIGMTKDEKEAYSACEAILERIDKITSISYIEKLENSNDTSDFIYIISYSGNKKDGSRCSGEAIVYKGVYRFDFADKDELDMNDGFLWINIYTYITDDSKGWTKTDLPELSVENVKKALNIE